MLCPHCHQETPDNFRTCLHCHKYLFPEDQNIAPDMEITSVSGANSSPLSILSKRFKIIKQLTSGGMGEIFLAEDLMMKRAVVIKALKPGTSEENRLRILKEAQAAGSLNHPNICPIFGIEKDETNYYLIMPFIDGINLDQLIKSKQLELKTILKIAIQIAEGLVEAHHNGILHRDIKPGNIMLDRNGRVIILDFGLAKDLRCKEKGLTADGIVMGTVAYMSPEQARGVPLDQRSDIFSFGILIYELLFGENPFYEPEQFNTMSNIVHKELEINGDIPTELKNLLQQMLQKDPEKRPDDCLEIKNRLTSILNSLSQKKESKEEQTEIISAAENQQLQKLLAKKESVSSSKELKNLVNRVIAFKASTEKVGSLKKSKQLKLKKFVTLSIFLALLAVALFYFFGHLQKRQTALIIRTSLVSAPDESSEALAFLITRSLEQSPDLAVFSDQEIGEYRNFKSHNKSNISEVDLLSSDFQKIYQLELRLVQYREMFELEAIVTDLKNKHKLPTITLTGESPDSLLINQIDNLVKRLFYITHGKEKEIIPTEVVFGKKWDYYRNLFQAIKLWERKELSAARTILLNLLQKSNPPPLSKYYLALIEDYSGLSGQAMQLLSEVNPQNFFEPIRLEIEAFRQKLKFSLPEQLKFLKKIQKRFFHKKDSFYQIAEAYFRYAQPENALRYYQRALQFNPAYGLALNHSGYCYSYLGEHFKALECFEAYRDTDKTANAYDSLGDGYFYAGDYLQAESSKLFALQLDPDIYWANLTLADIYILRADFTAAKKSLENYLRFDSSQYGQAVVKNRLALIAILEQDFQSASKLLDESLQIYNDSQITANNNEAHWLRGVLGYLQKDKDILNQKVSLLKKFINTYKISADNFEATLKYYYHLEALLNELETKIKKSLDFWDRLIALKPQLSYWITFFNYSYFATEKIDFLLRHNFLPEAAKLISEVKSFNSNFPALLLAEFKLLKKENDARQKEVKKNIINFYQQAPDSAFKKKIFLILNNND